LPRHTCREQKEEDDVQLSTLDQGRFLVATLREPGVCDSWREPRQAEVDLWKAQTPGTAGKHKFNDVAAD